MDFFFRVSNFILQRTVFPLERIFQHNRLQSIPHESRSVSDFRGSGISLEKGVERMQQVGGPLYASIGNVGGEHLPTQSGIVQAQSSCLGMQFTGSTAAQKDSTGGNIL